MDPDDVIHIGDHVYMPGAPKGHDTYGRVIDIRDHGLEVWVETFSNPPRKYYTFSDQLKITTVLDRLISDDAH